MIPKNYDKLREYWITLYNNLPATDERVPWLDMDDGKIYTDTLPAITISREDFLDMFNMVVHLHYYLDDYENPKPAPDPWHYWERPGRTMSPANEIADFITGWLEMCAADYAADSGNDWLNSGCPYSPPSIGFHDCGDGTCELTGYFYLTEALVEDDFYCTVDTAYDVALMLQMDVMPESLTKQLKGQ